MILHPNQGVPLRARLSRSARSDARLLGYWAARNDAFAEDLSRHRRHAYSSLSPAGVSANTFPRGFRGLESNAKVTRATSLEIAPTGSDKFTDWNGADIRNSGFTCMVHFWFDDYLVWPTNVTHVLFEMRADGLGTFPNPFRCPWKGPCHQANS